MDKRKWMEMRERIRVWIRFNGVAPAWPRRIGSGQRRCMYWQPFQGVQPIGFAPFAGIRHPRNPAHTSVSIIIEVAGRAAEHILVDCGAGVVESLVLARLPRIEDCTHLLVTHPHPDHLEPNALIETLRRAPGNDKAAFRLPVYGSAAVETMLNEKHPYERKYIKFNTVSHRQTITDVSHFRVTPLSVAHGRCKGAHAYVIEVQDRRVVVAFDLDTPEAVTASGRTNLQVFEDARERGELDDVDLLCLDANTFRARGTGHNSIIDSADYLDVIQPKQTKLLHFSGSEDCESDGRELLDDEVEEVTQRIYGPSVSMAAEGEMFSL
jgi:glyoxylase-like metal-dependent hydrolase (beta-lactamase superfamily II)